MQLHMEIHFKSGIVTIWLVLEITYHLHFTMLEVTMHATGREK